MAVSISFDLAKDAAKLAKRGMLLAEAAHLNGDWLWVAQTRGATAVNFVKRASRRWLIASTAWCSRSKAEVFDASVCGGPMPERAQGHCGACPPEGRRNT